MLPVKSMSFGFSARCRIGPAYKIFTFNTAFALEEPCNKLCGFDELLICPPEVTFILARAVYFRSWFCFLDDASAYEVVQVVCGLPEGDYCIYFWVMGSGAE